MESEYQKRCKFTLKTSGYGFFETNQWTEHLIENISGTSLFGTDSMASLSHELVLNSTFARKIDVSNQSLVTRKQSNFYLVQY